MLNSLLHLRHDDSFAVYSGGGPLSNGKPLPCDIVVVQMSKSVCSPRPQDDLTGRGCRCSKQLVSSTFGRCPISGSARISDVYGQVQYALFSASRARTTVGLGVPTYTAWQGTVTIPVALASSLLYHDGREGSTKSLVHQAAMSSHPTTMLD